MCLSAADLLYLLASGLLPSEAEPLACNSIIAERFYVAGMNDGILIFRSCPRLLFEVCEEKERFASNVNTTKY